MNENQNINVNEEVATTTTETNEEVVKTYTQEEVNALLQSYGDKRVNQALAKQKKQHEKELSLSKLDGSEREKAEKDSRIAELEEQLAQYQIERNKSELKSVLASRGLSAEFADLIVIGDDIETAQANIEKFYKLYNASVKAGVEKRLAGSNAPRGNGGATPELTKESAKKLSIAEMSALKDSNPELYNKLFN